MLLWTYLLCLLAATFVASQSPEILADPGDGVEAGDPVQSTSESPHVIRELLRARETNACPFGYGLCPNIPGRSVPLLFSRLRAFLLRSVVSRFMGAFDTVYSK